MGSKAKNKVISGYLNGASITHFLGEIKISGFAGNQTISKATVANIELVNSETVFRNLWFYNWHNFYNSVDCHIYKPV